MSLTALATAVLFSLDNFLNWTIGKNGFPVWIVFLVSFILVYFFHKQMILIIKKGLSLIGIK